VRVRACIAPKHKPTDRGGGQLLAGKVWSFLASAEAYRARIDPAARL
jgi:hypothetical protein